MQTPPIAVVLTLTGTGLAAVRDISRAGGRVFGVDDDRWRPGRYSRLVETIPDCSDQPLDTPLLDSLQRWANDLGVTPVLLPCGDAAVEWCIEQQAALATFCALGPAYGDGVAALMLDKLAFAERCQELGLDIPLTLVPRDHADIDAFIEQAGLPCIVKPRAGHRWRKRLRGQKLLVPQSRDELMRSLDEVIEDPTAVVLQEFIPGDEEEIVLGATLFSLDGSPRHVLTARKVRQFPRNFGSGSLVVSERLDEVARLSEQAVGALGYRGICGTEFKRDPRSGRLRLIEINPRPTLWFDLCRAAGCHLIAAHWQELGGGGLAPIADQRDGVVWRYWTRDLIALAQAHRQRPLEMLRKMATTPTADTHATMSWRDPTTVAATLVHTLVQAVEHLKR